jgi:hypothetical protein
MNAHTTPRTCYVVLMTNRNKIGTYIVARHKNVVLAPYDVETKEGVRDVHLPGCTLFTDHTTCTRLAYLLKTTMSTPSRCGRRGDSPCARFGRLEGSVRPRRRKSYKTFPGVRDVHFHLQGWWDALLTIHTTRLAICELSAPDHAISMRAS